MSASDCRKSRIMKGASILAAHHSALEMLDLALLEDPDMPVREIPEGILTIQSCVTGGSDPSLSGLYMSRDKCWLCHSPRSVNKDFGMPEDICKSKVGVLSEFLPWLCPDCEKTMEEEEKKVELTRISSVPVRLNVSDSEEYCNTSSIHHCDTCTEIRQAEAEHKKEVKEVQECWSELSQAVKQVYHMHCADASVETINIPTIKQLVFRLSEHDAHQLYQRLESQGREVVIEMKVKLLKVLTLDYKTAAGAYQFVSMLLEEYTKLCTSCQTLAVFLKPLVEQHLSQFCLTWQLHDKHLFHSIIFTDPVVQNCLPKAVENLRLGLTSCPDDNQVPYSKTLAEYERFVNEMSVISTTWKQSQRLIEKYDEKQAALKMKQKMFKEDWEFFKAQRQLLEQMVPKTKSSSTCHQFDQMQFQQMQKILQGNQEYFCPNCKQVRCSFDENSISHLITCGIISPEVVEETVSTGHHFHNDLPSFLNVKPPSVRSSDSSSGSESPMILERERFNLTYGDNYGLSDDEMTEDPVSDDDDDFHDAELAPPDCENISCHKLPEQTNGSNAEQNADVSSHSHGDGLDVDELVFKETKPSSVAKMTLMQVSISSDQCNCHHCQLRNGTPCMFSRMKALDVDVKKRFRHLLPPNPLLNLETYDIPMRVDSDDEKVEQETKIDNKETGHLCSKEERTSVTCDCLRSPAAGDKDMTDSFSHHNLPPLSVTPSPKDLLKMWKNCPDDLKEMLCLENLKMEAFTDQWNASRHKKNIHLKMSEKKVDEVVNSAEASEPDQEKQQLKKTVNTGTATSVSVSTGNQCSVSVLNRTHPATTTAATTQLPQHAKTTSGQLPDSTTVCSNISGGKSVKPLQENPTDVLKSPFCSKASPQKPITTASSTSTAPSAAARSQYKAASSSSGSSSCSVHSCERLDDATDWKADGSDRSTSQKEGKHCECWHCEFFGHETPSSVPMSKNYLEMRDRLRLQLKKKKERMNQSSNSESSQSTGRLSSAEAAALDDMAMDDILRYINGCDVQEDNNSMGKVPRSSSRATSKKNKKHKKSRENVQVIDASSKLHSSSGTTGSLGSLVEEQLLSKLSSDSSVDRAHVTLTSILDSVRNAHRQAEADQSTLSEKMALNSTKKGISKNLRARSAALERHLHLASSGTSSSSQPCNNTQTFAKPPLTLEALESAVTLAKLKDLHNAQLNSILNKAMKTRSALHPHQVPDCHSNGEPHNSKKSVEPNRSQLDMNKKIQSKSMQTSHATGQIQIPAEFQKPTQQPLSSPTLKGKKPKRKNQLDNNQLSVDEVFLPRESHEEVEPEDYDRVVEEFKRFCFSTPPLQKREKLRVPLNLKDIFNRNHARDTPLKKQIV